MQPELKKWCRVFLNCASKVQDMSSCVYSWQRPWCQNVLLYCMIALKHSLLFTYITDAAICITLYQINTWNVTLCQRTIASYTHAHHTCAHMHVHTHHSFGVSCLLCLPAGGGELCHTTRQSTKEWTTFSLLPHSLATWGHRSEPCTHNKTSYTPHILATPDLFIFTSC